MPGVAKRRGLARKPARKCLFANDAGLKKSNFLPFTSLYFHPPNTFIIPYTIHHTSTPSYPPYRTRTAQDVYIDRDVINPDNSTASERASERPTKKQTNKQRACYFYLRVP